MNRFFFILGAVILLIIGIVSVGLLLWKRSTSGDQVAVNQGSSPVANTGTTGTPASGDGGTGAPLIPPQPERPEAEVTLENVIRDFVERYGSYSTHFPFANIDRTEKDMTERFRKEEKKKIKAIAVGAPFYGVTVRVQSVNIVEQSSTRARALVETQWEEERGAEQPQSSRRRMEIVLIKEGEIWKVDRAIWK